MWYLVPVFTVLFWGGELPDVSDLQVTAMNVYRRHPAWLCSVQQ